MTAIFDQLMQMGTRFGLDAWVINLVIVVALLVIAIAAALVLHLAISALLERLFGFRRQILHSVLKRTRNVSRYGLVILMISIVQPLAPLDAQTSDALHRILLAAVIVWIGWIALTAVDASAQRYVARFKLDTAENFLARKAVTQVRVLHQAVDVLVVIITASFALMTFDSVRQFGISLFASAGIAGLAAGFAAKSVFSNLIAGVQLAVTQPIRLDDVVIVEGEYGEVEEITSTYIVLKLWDLRRMIVPLSYFFEKPFQNWTRASTSLIGSVVLYVDYSVPVDRVRAEALAIIKSSKLWDGKTASLQVIEAMENTVQLRALVSASNSSRTWDLRCELREKLLGFLLTNFPEALPKRRVEMEFDPKLQLDGASLRKPAEASGGQAKKANLT